MPHNLNGDLNMSHSEFVPNKYKANLYANSFKSGARGMILIKQ